MSSERAGVSRVCSFLADKYGGTPGQMILAWHVNVGLCAVPKSSKPQRLVQNLRAQDIDLDPADIARQRHGTAPSRM
ncbi:MAG: aldo/keto reductase [Actinomycetes bacterium]